MPTPYGSAFAVAQTTLGMALETVRGTPVQPTIWLPIRAPKYTPDRMFIPDQSLQGSMVTTYNLTPGMRYDKHGWDSYPYLDTFPVMIRAQLGSPDTMTAAPTSTTLNGAVTAGALTVTVLATAPPAGSFVTIGSGATKESHKVASVASLVLTLATALVYNQPSGAAVTGLTKHVFSLLNNVGAGNQPPTYTISDYDGDQWRQISAAQMDKLTIKGNATALVDYTADWLANPSITPATPSPAFTTVTPVPSWTSALVIGGVQQTDVEEWTVDLARGTKPIAAVTGTLNYYEFFAGPITASTKFTVVNTGGAPELTQFQNGVNQPFDLFVNDVVTGYIMEIHSGSMIYKTGELARTKEYTEAELAGDLLPTAGDATAGGVSPLQITIANGQTTVY